ncbi:MAG: hypothetical protein K0S97_2332 [Chloroflexota bacterium]|nr:hypothetical protein [Chloroflexota bacterium]
MRRLALVIGLIGVLALPASVSAHPSENRNDQGFGGGPHCHFILAAPEGTRAYPSHTAHSNQLQRGPAGAVFAATVCD